MEVEWCVKGVMNRCVAVFIALVILGVVACASVSTARRWADRFKGRSSLLMKRMYAMFDFGYFSLPSILAIVRCRSKHWKLFVSLGNT